MKTKAAVQRAWAEPYTIEELELDPPKEGEVLVKVAHTGYCHSDLSGWKGIYGLDILPCVAGHEAAGVVEAVGPGVTTLPARGSCGFLLAGALREMRELCQREHPHLRQPDPGPGDGQVTGRHRPVQRCPG